jgi:hypothetical protein
VTLKSVLVQESWRRYLKGNIRKFSVVVDSMIYLQYSLPSDCAQNKPTRDIVGHIASVSEQLNVSCRVVERPLCGCLRR